MMFLETGAGLYENALKAFIMYVVTSSGVDMYKHECTLLDTEMQMFVK